MGFFHRVKPTCMSCQKKTVLGATAHGRCGELLLGHPPVTVLSTVTADLIFSLLMLRSPGVFWFGVRHDVDYDDGCRHDGDGGRDDNCGDDDDGDGNDVGGDGDDDDDEEDEDDEDEYDDSMPIMMPMTMVLTALISMMVAVWSVRCRRCKPIIGMPISLPPPFLTYIHAGVVHEEPAFLFNVAVIRHDLRSFEEPAYIYIYNIWR